MKKIVKGIVCAGLCCTLLTSAACAKDSGGINPETRQLLLATSALDGNFNPFFYTSQNDGNILSLTQIGMITLDANGNVAVGEDQACAVLDYSISYYDEEGQPSATGNVDGSTEYQFVIKNGIKFSDGVDLTIKDVLFNLYVYLDPAYSGSSTIYSTDIQGLKAYRTQEDVDDDATDDFDKTFAVKAQARITDVIEWSRDSAATETEPADLQIRNDLNRVKELFREEATTDWTSVETSWAESYKNSHRFTAAWQAYLFNEGIVQVQTKLNNNGVEVQQYEDKNGNGKRDDGELYYTTLDAPVGTTDAPEAQQYIDDIAAATTAAKISEYQKAHNNCTEEYARTQLEKEFCVNAVVANYTDKSNVDDVLTYWATASNALEEFTGEERSKHYQQLKEDGELPVPTIKGITTDKTANFKGKSLGADHDVLKIKINGIDPKAIYNFGFTVAPMHYYSGKYDVNGDGTMEDLVAQADGKTHFGVDLGNKDFYDTVLKSTDKNGLPVGAGCYQATNSSGGAATRTTFYENNIVYFKRNDYFTTLGSGINNAKIKYVNYKVMSDDKIMDALETQSIDYGMPNATPTNANAVATTKHLTEKHYQTGGYGYVGINPKFVPEYKVRQALMKAMNTRETIGYYGTTLASTIYRPLSLTSWVYDYIDQPTEHASIKYATNDSEIVNLVTEAGYTRENGNGVFTKTRLVDGMANAAIGTKLKITFTIAGETTDHPAFLMFTNARDRLNALGFDITVQTDIQALKKMNTGNLAVWAAAWSAASDPDPYQVYHMDSKATSVKNWNYPEILNDVGKWSHEYGIIYDLSEKIDDGRETLEQSERSEIYEECLNLIMELAVELPTYQRNDMCVYNNNIIDAASLPSKPTIYIGLFDRIWEIDYVK